MTKRLLVVLSLLALPLHAQIDPELLAGMKARAIGPAAASGRISSIDVVTSNPDIRPIQVGLNAFRAEAGSSYHLLMAAAAFCVAPIVLLYLVGQRYLVQGVARTGIRG